MFPYRRIIMSSAAALSTLLFLLSCSPTPGYLRNKNVRYSSELRDVRVLLARSKDSMSVSSGSRISIREKKSGRLIYDGKGGALKITPEKTADVLVIESWGGYISLNGSPYRGSVEVHNVMGCLHAVNILTMTDYLKSVVPSEIPSGWPSEALKAQAIAARTYAYYHIFNDKNRGIYDLDCSTSFQVYRGMSAEKPATSKAVDDTNGIVITENSRPIISYFHSTCGGKTADDRYVWQGTDNGYLSSVKCEYCRDSPQYSWSGALDIVEIRRALEKKYPNTGKISNITFSRNEDRVTEVRVTHKNGVIRLSGNDFRLMFPPKTVKSLFFTAQKKDQTLILSGHGWGHGVGLCQWGARGMALQGMDFKKILGYYYRDTRLVNIRGLQNRSVALERAGTKRQ